MDNTKESRSHTIPLLTHILTNSRQNPDGKSCCTLKEKFKHVQNCTVPPFTIFYAFKIIQGHPIVKIYQPVALSIMYTSEKQNDKE